MLASQDPLLNRSRYCNHLCTSSYCSFNRVDRASTDRSLSVVKRTPAFARLPYISNRGKAERAREFRCHGPFVVLVVTRTQAPVSKRNEKQKARFWVGRRTQSIPASPSYHLFQKMILMHGTATLDMPGERKYRIPPTFCTERVKAALHLPTNA